MKFGVGRLGLRREVLILVPVAIFLAVFLSIFTLLGYRNALDLVGEERRSEAARLARGLADELTRSRRDIESLRPLVPQARDLALVDGEASTVPAEVRTGQRFAVGPDASTADAVVGWAPLGPGARHYLRVELPADALAREWGRLRVLTPVVLAVDAGLAVLVLVFLSHLLAPFEQLLDRARAAGAVPPAEADEVSFLLTTFERALSALTPANDGDSALSALERALPTSFDKSGVLLLDPGGLVLALNRFGADLLGVEPPEPRRLAVETLLGAHPRLAELLARAMAGGRGVEREECAITTPGGQSTLGITVHPLRRDDGTFQGHLALFADLTEVHQRADRARAAENLRELGELAAGAAHELRNSLATLRGYLGLAERAGTDESERAATYWSEIHRETRHLKRVLDDFLTFARPETARFEQVDLLDLVARAAADPVLTESHIEVAAPATSLPYLSADPQLLERALKNLLANAREANGDTGRVEIDLGFEVEAGEVHVTVADRGPGVRPEIRERLFRPFASGRPQGVGLGLALAQRIAVLHGGRLALEDRPGGGTRAILSFPLVTSATESSAGSTAPEESAP
jgi:signal transduction histidine kinase